MICSLLRAMIGSTLNPRPEAARVSVVELVGLGFRV